MPYQSHSEIDHLTSKMINIKMANTSVVNVSTVVGNKVTETDQKNKNKNCYC